MPIYPPSRNCRPAIPGRFRGLLGLGAGLLLGAAAAAAAPQVISLWPEGVPGGRKGAGEKQLPGGRIAGITDPTLTVLPAGTPNGTAVIVCPGGSYRQLSFEHEGYVPARWLNGLGVTAFIIKNRLAEYGQPAPLQDICRAVRLVRSRAAEFQLRPDRIGVLGFSAGGHLAASAATLFSDPLGMTGTPLDATPARPDFALLVYPVITMASPYAHAGSRHSLLGDAPSAEAVAQWSLEQQVTARTPPVFLVATEEDKTVPVMNSVLFYEALKRAGVPGELHLYERGPHGFGLNPGLGPTSEWPRRAEDWMRSHGWLSP